MSNATVVTVTEVVDAYLASLGEPDANKRSALISESWTAGGRYVDPARDVRGAAEMDATIEGVQEHTPGATFRRTTAIDSHHEYLRFGWEMLAGDGSVALSGIDIGVVAEDGKLRTITGFFGDLPAA